MSLIFMVLLLVGVVLVLGGGSYALRRVIAFLEERFATVEKPGPGTASAAEPEPIVGGYVPGPRVFDELPSSLRTRVLNLVVLGRTEEAVRVVRDRVNGDEDRARRIVTELGKGDTGRELCE